MAGVALDHFINLRAPNRVSSPGIFAQDELTNLLIAFFRDGRRETRLELFLETLLVPSFPEINSGSPRRIVRATVRVRVRGEARRLGPAQDYKRFCTGWNKSRRSPDSSTANWPDLRQVGFESGQGVRAGAHDIRINVAKAIGHQREVGGLDRLCR